jgi:hypothetical protein
MERTGRMGRATWSELSSSATLTDASDAQKNDISLGPFNGSCQKESGAVS